MLIKTPILKTKLNRPRCFQKYFKRTRLEQLLDKSLSKTATLIIAGAGYGKSTLVSQWLDNKKAVWISCDADMNDLQVLINYLVEGFQQEVSFHFKQTQNLLLSQNEISDEVLINTFISEADTIEANTTVVFDDFHLLKSDRITAFINTFLNYPPKAIHLLIISRHDLSWSFEKQRLNNGISEIRIQDLNLTKQELKAYAKDCFDVNLSSHSADLLLNQTEGWFLGCTQIISNESFNSSDLTFKTVLKTDQFNNYFKEEVITKQSESSRLILFVASLFYRFNRQLIRECLSGIEKEITEDEILRTLSNKSNFTISLDNQNEWFRFHHQFQDALSGYFTDSPYSKFKNTCLRVGGLWFIEKEYYEEGVTKLLEGGFQDEAIKEFQHFRYELLNTDQYARLDSLLALFSQTDQSTNVDLSLAKAVILENQGKYVALAEHIKLLNNDSKQLTTQQKGELKVWQALVLFYSGHYQQCLQLINEAIDLLEDYSASIITFAFAYKALALNNLGKDAEAIHILKVRLDSLHIKQYQSIARTLISKAIVYSMQSDLLNRKKIVPRIIELSEKHKYYETLGMGIYFFAEQNYRTGFFDKCEKEFGKALEYKYLMRPLWYAYLLGIHVYCNLVSKQNQLNDSISQLDLFVDELNADNLAQFRDTLLIEVALRNKEFNKALQLDKTINYHLYPPLFYYFLPQIVQLKLLLYTDKTTVLNPFYKASEQLWKYAKAQNHKNLLLKLNIVTAEAKYKQSKTEEALEYMETAIRIAESTGDVMVFGEFSELTEFMLNDLAKKHKADSYLHHILKILPKSDLYNKLPIKLKERDQNILKMVSEGHSNKEIAEALYLSTESIKKYLYDIYQELGVKNRTSAVVKAKELGLLPL